MPRARNGDTELEYEELGPTSGEPILLIMGIGGQLTAWNDEFCELLVEHGHRVVRFDNRDVGLSSRTPGSAPTQRDLAPLLLRQPGARQRVRVPYDFSDMAADTVAVMDAAGMASAHVVGASMGGMIAQTLAIEHPERVRSLTSIMSNTGALRDGVPTFRVMRNAARSRPVSPAEALESDLARTEMISGPHFDRAAARATLERSQARAFTPEGVLFQAAAIFASPDRTPRLRQLRVPTLVIHGRLDPLVRLRGGIATARAVPGAELIVHHDMAHDLPRPLWPSITRSISAHASRPVITGSSA
ncbi:alpha/beta hydrolase [soil metagenome]